MNNWLSVEEGRTVGTVGSENGRILQDEEHREGARITLEQCASPPFAITCGIYGLMAHTAFASSKEEGQKLFERMKKGLEELLRIIPEQDDPQIKAKLARVYAEIQAFVNKF